MKINNNLKNDAIELQAIIGEGTDVINQCTYNDLISAIWDDKTNNKSNAYATVAKFFAKELRIKDKDLNDQEKQVSLIFNELPGNRNKILVEIPKVLLKQRNEKTLNLINAIRKKLFEPAFLTYEEASTWLNDPKNKPKLLKIKALDLRKNNGYNGYNSHYLPLSEAITKLPNLKYVKGPYLENISPAMLEKFPSLKAKFDREPMETAVG